MVQTFNIFKFFAGCSYDQFSVRMNYDSESSSSARSAGPSVQNISKLTQVHNINKYKIKYNLVREKMQRLLFRFVDLIKL